MDSSALSWIALLVLHGVELLAIGHAIIHKRDARSAAGWVALIILSPGIGVLLYFLLGINRIKPRHLKHRADLRSRVSHLSHQQEIASLPQILQVGSRIQMKTCTSGNRVKILENGDQAYPLMLSQIHRAQRSIELMTYIFDNDSLGREFAKALGQAIKRGVQVKVLIDAVGARYTFPSVFRTLRSEGIHAKKFLDTRYPWRFHYAQLRNHKKSLIIDGVQAYTGGINIRLGHWLSRSPKKSAVQDLHFLYQGPVVRDLREEFFTDWEFTTRERLYDPNHPTSTQDAKLDFDHPTICRVITDGPTETIDAIRWTMLGAICCAKKNIRVLTPYFLPDEGLIAALGAAALRGVEVDIVLPAKNNLRFVQWATQAMLGQVLEKGCRVYLSPPPFDHSKVLLIDDHWSFVGSANWDARSLRLNFELNVENYDAAFSQQLLTIFLRKQEKSRLVTLQEIEGRPTWIKLRDGAARLLSPYL